MDDKQKNPSLPQENIWDESRLVVFLIGLCLVLEAGLIHYQAGESQIAVTGVVGVSGVILLLFAWFVPLEEPPQEELVEIEEKPKELDLKPEAEKIALPVDEKKEVALEKVVAPPTQEEKPAEPPKPIQAAPLPEAVQEKEVEEPPLSWLERVRVGLQKTREGFVKKIKNLVFGKVKIDANLLEEIERILFEADIGVKNVQELLDHLHKRVETEEIKDSNLIFQILRDDLKKRLTKFSVEPNFNPNGMTVFLIIGVNGVGKTTTIAKLAKKYVKEGKKVILAAGDTFRAAAIDQLAIWGERAGAEVIKGKEGGDPGALVFDAIHAGKKRGADLLIIDTAGRMHVKTNLMDELKKIKKITEKETDGGPHEIFLVIDSTTGQNAVQQAKLFNEALPISGIILTKLDGTAKGGVIFSVQENLDVPVKFIGIGEKMGDLLPFDPEKFLEALFEDDAKSKTSDYKVL